MEELEQKATKVFESRKEMLLRIQQRKKEKLMEKKKQSKDLAIKVLELFDASNDETIIWEVKLERGYFNDAKTIKVYVKVSELLEWKSVEKYAELPEEILKIMHEIQKMPVHEETLDYAYEDFRTIPDFTADISSTSSAEKLIISMDKICEE